MALNLQKLFFKNNFAFQSSLNYCFLSLIFNEILRLE